MGEWERSFMFVGDSEQMIGSIKIVSYLTVLDITKLEQR